MKPIRIFIIFMTLLNCATISVSSGQQPSPNFTGQWKLKKIGVDANNNGKIEPGEIKPPPFSMRYVFNNDHTGSIMAMGQTGATFTWAMNGDKDIVITEKYKANKSAAARVRKLSGSKAMDDVATLHIEKLNSHLFDASWKNSSGQLVWYYFKK